MDFLTLPDFPEVPWLCFARENTGDEGSGAGGDGQSVCAPANLACEDTTDGAKPPSETAGALPGEMLTAAGFYDVSAAPLEVAIADS